MTGTAQWYGGPFDGSWERVTPDLDEFAVAWDAHHRRIYDIPDLQMFCLNRRHISSSRKIVRVHHIDIYPVIDLPDLRRIIIYRERCPCTSGQCQVSEQVDADGELDD